jgi:hypothetical protein
MRAASGDQCCCDEEQDDCATIFARGGMPDVDSPPVVRLRGRLEAWNTRCIFLLPTGGSASLGMGRNSAVNEIV